MEKKTKYKMTFTDLFTATFQLSNCQHIVGVYKIISTHDPNMIKKEEQLQLIHNEFFDCSSFTKMFSSPE